MKLQSALFVSLISVLCVPAFGRTWTDQQGKQVEAEYLRVHNGRVILKQKGRVIPIPFEQLSAADQEFLREQLEKSGQANLLPPVRTQSPAGNATQPGVPSQPLEAGPNQAGNPPPAVPLNPQGLPSPPSILPPPSALPPPGPPFPQQPVAASPTNLPPAVTPQLPFSNPPPTPAPTLPVTPASIPANSSSPAMTPPGFRPQPNANPFAPNPALNPPMQMVATCSNCKKVVPENIGAGDNCPHCGTYFQYEQGVNGERKYAKWGKRGAVGLVVTVIALLAGWAKNRA